MKTKIFFLILVIFLFAVSAPPVRGDRDTCQVLSVDNLLAYSHAEVEVRVFVDQKLAGLTIPLTWDDVSPDIVCDSIGWSDWFWNNPAQLVYSGETSLENYIDSTERTIEIVAAWSSSPYLPVKDTTLAVIHFTVGRMDLVQPNGGEEWMAGEAKWIRWLPQCDWNVNDSVVINFFRSNPQTPGVPPINFSDSLGGDTDSVQFKPGYFVRAPENLDSVKIEYSHDAGKTWDVVVSSTPNNSEYLWASIPDTPSDTCLLRITSNAQNPLSVTSAGFFTIAAETTDVVEEEGEQGLPATFALHQNYPNPFNPSTRIEFSLLRRAQVALDIYNIAGERVKRLVSEELPAGHWSVVWNGEDDHGVEVASGVYFYRLRTPEYTQTRKMVIIR